MKEQNAISEKYPKMTDLVAAAADGRVDELLLGLARRQDEAERILYERAVAAFDHRTDNPKASWGEVENSGVSQTEPKPENQEPLVRALLSYCTERRVMKMIEENRAAAEKAQALAPGKPKVN